MALAKTTPVLSLDKDSISYIAGNLHITYEETKVLIANVMQDALEWTLNDMKTWIKMFVPKRTGQLQDNLLKNIESSRVVNFTLKLIIRTSIDYASDVNAMSDAQVQHDSTWFEHSGKRAYAYYYGHYGKIFLDDPEAKGNFFQELQDFAKTRTFINLVKAKARHYDRVYYSEKKGYFYSPPKGKYLVM